MVNLDQFVLASFVLIGLVNLVQMAIDGNWKSFAKGMTAVIAGSVFGVLKWFGLPGVEMGIAVGIGSSGLYKGIQMVSKTVSN